MFNRIGKGLRTIDVYKEPVNLLLQGQESSSSCGGIVTIVIIIISVILFFQPTINFASFT